MNSPARSRRRFWRSPPAILGVFFYLIAGVARLVSDFASIAHCTISTASVGYVFAPIGAAIRSVPWFGVGLGAGYAVRAIRTRQRKDVGFAAILCLASAAFVTYVCVSFFEKQELSREIECIRQMDANQLETFLTGSPFRRNKFALGAVCQNPQATAHVLARVAALDEPELHHKMWSDPHIMGENRKGLAVMRLVSHHPNVTSEILASLAASPDPCVRGDVAANDRTPTEVLESLFNGMRSSKDSYLIEWGLAGNARTPSALLDQLSTSRNQYTLRGLSENSSLPAAVRQQVRDRLNRRDYE